MHPSGPGTSHLAAYSPTRPCRLRAVVLLPRLLSLSSYFWPLGMVALLRESACCSDTSLEMPSAPLRLAPRRAAFSRVASLSSAWLRLASLRSAWRRSASCGMAVLRLSRFVRTVLSRWRHLWLPFSHNLRQSTSLVH